MVIKTTNMNTHITTTPNKRPPTAIESLKQSMSGDYMTQITNYYGGDKQEAMRFMTSAVEYVRKVPKLLETDKTSLMMALVTAAQFRFLPSNVSGESYILPYGKEAKFQMGYQGYVTLLYRTGLISTISSNIIYANDVFEYAEGLDPVLIHKPTMFGKPKGEVIGVYTVVVMKDGGKTFKVMDVPSIMAIKNLSKAKGSASSPWNSNDPEKWMYRKTCLIQHQKLLPKTSELSLALEKDYEGEGMDRGTLIADGPATAKASHSIVHEPVDNSFDDIPSTPYNEGDEG